MNTQLTRFLSALLLLTTTLLVSAAENRKDNEPSSVIFETQNFEVGVEVASEKAQREQGLMHRTHLDENRGMLFIFPDQAVRGVWMKNTLLALDVLFLTGDGRIVTMLRNLQPCRSLSCPTYDSQLPARYMLELNAGFIDRHQVKTGQRVHIR